MPAADWLSEPLVSTRHEVLVPLEPERALAHALAVPLAPDPVVQALLRLRGLRTGGNLGSLLSQGKGFTVLSKRPTAVVAGIAAAMWRRGGSKNQLGDASEWAGWDRPGTVRVVMTLEARGTGGWSRLITETAVQATDEGAARAFRRYWTLVGPFSKLIRRRWLHAIKLRAQQV